MAVAPDPLAGGAMGAKDGRGRRLFVVGAAGGLATLEEMTV
jgi:hypothetical protein